MKTSEIKIEVDIKIDPQMSWLDALKLRLAGGKYMKKFWHEVSLALQTQILAKKKN